MNLRHEVLRGLYWIGGTRLLGQVVTWLITIVVIRLLTPDDYGLLALATLFVGFFLVLGEAGLGTALVQTPQLNEGTLRVIFAASILVNGAFALLLLAGAPLIAQFFSDARLTSVVRVLSLQFLLSILAVVPGATLTRRLDFKRLSLANLVASVCGGLCTLTLALSGYGVWSLVVGTLVGSALYTAAVNLVAPFSVRPDFSFRGARRHLVFGGQVTGARLLWYCYTQADVLIAGRLLGGELLGFYSVAKHFASLPAQKLMSVLNPVAFPAFAQTQRDLPLVAQHIVKSLRLLSLVAVPVLWGISSIAEEIVTVILGPKWQAAIIPLRLLSLVMPLTMIGAFLNTAFQGIGHAGIVLRNVLTACIVLPPAFWIGSHWELFGLSLVWVLAFPMVLAVNLGRMLPLVGLRWGQVLVAAAPAAVGGCWMYGAVMLIRYLAEPVAAPARMVILILIGAATYSVLIWMINRNGVMELAGLLARTKKPVQ